MGEGSKKIYIFFRVCLSLYDSQSKANWYSNRLTYLKNKVTTNQKHSVDSQKTKPRKLERNAEENNKTTKGKTKIKRRTKEMQNQLEKQDLKWK